MTEEELKEIEKRARRLPPSGDIPKLIAEVRRLQSQVSEACSVARSLKASLSLAYAAIESQGMQYPHLK